jgi:hemin uptake protein HemP
MTSCNSESDKTPAPEPSSALQAAASQKPTVIAIDFLTLSRGRPEIIVIHQGSEYRLRATRRGGLILTK